MLRANVALETHGFIVLRLRDTWTLNRMLLSFHKMSTGIACENSRPSSLPARVAFREKDVGDLPPKIPY